MHKQKNLYGISRKVPVIREPLHLLSWVERGKMRKRVFLAIEKRSTPSQVINKVLGHDERKSASHYAQISRALRELEMLSLIKCLNPQERTGRFYQLTKRGENLRRELLEGRNLY